MALIESKVRDKIELVGDERYRTFQIREDNRIYRDGALISDGNYSRYTLVPGKLENGLYVRTDTSQESQEVRTITAACWTEDTHRLYEEYLTALRDNG